MAAHGCDTSEKLPVPPGCVYVTYGLCGMATLLNSTIDDLFFKMFKAKNPILQDPVKNYVKLKELFGNSIHIHYPEAPTADGQTYFDNTYTPFLAWEKTDQSCFAYKSGLYEIGANLFTDDSENSGKRFLCNDGKFSKIDFETMYNESKFPTTAMVYDAYYTKFSFMDKGIPIMHYNLIDEVIDENFRVKQSELFEKFPGIYYNFVCRSDCSSQNNSKGKRIDNRFVNLPASPAHLMRRQNSEIASIAQGSKLIYYLLQEDYDAAKNEIQYNIHNLEYLQMKVNGKTALGVCCEKNYNELTKMLLDSGITIANTDYQTCMRWAWTKDSEIFNKLTMASATKRVN